MKDYYLVFIKDELADLLGKLYSDIQLYIKDSTKYLCVKRIVTESPFLNAHVYVDQVKNPTVKTINLYLPLNDIICMQYVTDPNFNNKMGF